MLQYSVLTCTNTYLFSLSA